MKVFTVISLILILLTVVNVAGCEQSSIQSRIKVVDYDGHKWVIYRYSSHGGIAHHPDCECNKE
jgi:hypothetical protein